MSERLQADCSNIETATEVDFPENHRTSSVINKEYVRRWALDYCASHKLFSKKNKVRVSKSFLGIIEAATKSAIIHRIESGQYSAKSKTLI